MVFYRSFLEALEDMEADKCKELLMAIGHYAMDDEVPSLTGEVKRAFTLIKPQIDSNNKRAEDGKKGGQYGHLGGRPKKNPIGDIGRNPIGDNIKTPNVNDNANVNANIYKPKNKFCEFEQSGTDLDALERKLFGE